MEGEESLARLRSICHIGSWLAVIAGIVLVCFLVATAVAVSMCSLDPTFALPAMTHDQSCVSAVKDLLFFAFNIVLCMIAYRILSHTSDNYTPFTHENVVGLKTVSAVALLAFAVILIAEVLMFFLMGMEEIYIDFSMEFIVLAVITYMFALLMEYGTALQTESDHFL